jgi:uncharacterized membrane protein
MKQKNMLLLITTIVMGLTAGIFYCWSISVTPGIALLPDKEYITTFQQLDRAILNPLFMICFMGLALLLPVCTWVYYQKTLPLRFWLLLAASALYIFGVVGLTMTANVPMNESLSAFNTDTATVTEISARRLAHEGRWNFLNNVRTVCCVICLAFTVLACMIQKDAKEINFNL